MIVIKVLLFAVLLYSIVKLIRINPCYKFHVALAIIFIYQAINWLIGKTLFDEYLMPISTVSGIYFFVELVSDFKEKEDECKSSK